jgi:hypothetical protein
MSKLNALNIPKPGFMRHNGIARMIFFILTFLFSDLIQAQTDQQKYIEKGNGLIALQVGIPSKAMQAAIENKMGNLGFGIGVSGFTNPFSWGRNKHNSPLRIGGEAGYTYYGRFLSDVNINGSRGDYKTSYGIVQLNAILQLRPSLPEVVSPFLEVLGGGNFYLSTTKENLSAIESSLGITAFDMGSYSSASFNKGVAVGCSFGKPRRDQARFTVRLSYNWGKNIKYVVRNSLAYNSSNGHLEYYTGSAPVRYLMAQLGIGF